MRTITLKIEEDLLKEVDKYAEEHGLFRSEVIRLAIREFLRPNTTTYKS
jgi:metal-responsive CopG/Arc/MetJ family transcriptional regulator